MASENVFMFTSATHRDGKRVAITPTMDFKKGVLGIINSFNLKFCEADFESLVVQTYNMRINGNFRNHKRAFTERTLEFYFKKGRLNFLKDDATNNGIELTEDVVRQFTDMVRNTDMKVIEVWAKELHKLRWGQVA